MTRTIRTLACFVLWLLPLQSWAIDDQTYALAVVATPGTCNGFLHYTVNKRYVSNQTAVLLYHLIRFAYGTEEPTDPKNTFYKRQFGFNPSNLRINQFSHDTTIVPPTVDEMITKLGDPDLKNEKSDEKANLGLEYLNVHLDRQLRPAVRRIVRYRYDLVTQGDMFDRDPEAEFKKAGTLIQPLIDFYSIRVRQNDSDC